MALLEAWHLVWVSRRFLVKMSALNESAAGRSEGRHGFQPPMQWNSAASSYHRRQPPILLVETV